MTVLQKINATLEAMANGVNEYTPGCGLYRFLVIRTILKNKAIKPEVAPPALVLEWLNEYDAKAAEREDERMNEKPDIKVFSLNELLSEIKRRGVVVNGTLHIMQELKF
jgi:hypothetical protein